MDQGQARENVLTAPSISEALPSMWDTCIDARTKDAVELDTIVNARKTDQSSR